MNKDIETDLDIEVFVRKQYALLLADSDTSPKFSHINLEEHFPRIFGFWKMVVFAQPMAYTGNAFEPHIKLGLEKIHFEKWIAFLTLAVQEKFAGPHADKVLQHAKLMAFIFQSKLGAN